MENDGKMHPLLSIIVPVYNMERYLERCVSSILRQTFQDMEIILVDDGSTDGSLQICKKFQSQDTRVRVFSKENGGLVRARKTGLSHARGELIGFVDSDDWIETDMYAQLVKCMEETGCDLVSSGFVRDQGLQEPVSVFDHYEEGLYRDLGRSVYPAMLYDGRYGEFGLHCVLWSKVFRRQLLDKVYADINEDVFYGEDAIALYPYCLLAESIYILHKAYYHYNIRSDSMCAASDERLPHNNYMVYKELASAFSRSDCKWVLMRQLKHYMLLLEKHNLLRLYHINTEAMGKWNFGCCEKLSDRKFVIYGAGVCGQALYEEICREGKETDLAGWIDKEAEKRMSECAYQVQKPESLSEMEWDILIIAVRSRKLAEQIMKDLSDLYGVGKERMLWAEAEQILGYNPAEH